MGKELQISENQSNEAFSSTLDRQIEESQSMIAALTADYLNVYVIEPETDHGTILKLDGYVINGIKETPKNFTYSKVLRTYAKDRVCDEDREEFLKTVLPDALIESFSNGREKLELKYRVPVDGKLEHYSGLYSRISKAGETLKIIAGFRSTEDVISIQKKTRNEGLYSAYQAVSDLYLAMFRVNIKNNTYSSIKTTEAVKKYTLPDSDRYDENLKAIITALADEYSLSSALEFLNLNTIAERMQGRTHIVSSFNGRVAGACKLHLIKEDGATDDELTHVILAVEVLENEEYHSVLNVLTENYWNVYLLNPEDDTAKVLKYTDGLDKANLNSGQVTSYTQTLHEWVRNKVYSEDQDRLLKVLDIDYVCKELKKQKKYEGNYRRSINGGIQNFQFIYTKLGKSDHILVAFQNIDSIIEEHRAMEEQKRKLEEAYQKETEEQMAIINTLSKSFKNVFIANLNKGTAKVVRLTDGYDVKAVIDVKDKEFPFDTVVKRWVKENVHPDDKAKVAQALDLENLRSVFSEQDEYVGTYRSTEGGELHHYQFDFRKADDEGNVVAGFQIIDEVVEEQNAHQKELEDQFAIINTLSSSFMNIYLANLNDGSAKAIRIAGDYGYKEVQALKDVSFSFDEIIRIWAEKYIYPNEDKAKMTRMLSLANLQKVFSKQDNYVGTYQSTEQGGVHHYQFDIRKVDDAGNVVAGFQNIDAIIEEHEAQEKEKRELEEARLKGEKEHAEVVNSLSTIYSTIFRADTVTHRYKILGSVPLMSKVAPITGNFDDVKKTIIENFMEPEFREPLSEFLDLNTLADRLDNVNTVTTDYKAPTGQWMQARFIAKRRDENGRAVETLYVARDITEEKTRDLKQQEDLAQALEVTRRDKEELQKTAMMLKEAGAISDALSRDYSNVFLVQPKKNLGKTVKEENYNVKGIEAYSGEWFDYTFYIRKYIEVRVYEPDVEMMLEKTELSRVLKEIENNTDFSISYRALVDGKVHYLQMRYVSVEGTDLVAVGFRYVDDVVKAEAEQKELLQEALAAAQQANKAKTTFLNSMSHDIRTPMNAIIGFTALAQTHLEDRALVEDYLSKISTSSNHLLSLINDILDMSRIESGTVKLDEKAVHIPDLLHDLRTMIQSLVNSKNLNLFIDTQDVMHEDVLTDKLRLNQVLLNIVGNAIKFTQPGGDIIIRLIEKPCNLKHYITYEFSVKDNGIGMSEEFVGHIFDTFSREYSSTVSGIQGTGLGMAITKNIVDMMGGDIQVESEEGKGSLFTVTINLRLANEPVKNEPIPELLGARALIVDDDMNTCRSVSKMLRDIQMRPDWTTSAKEAIVHAQDASEVKDEYKVYIIDYLMPDMNGIETVRRIRKVISEDVPIIVLTAYDWEDFEHEAREAGVTAFVSKPIFMSELREVLTQPVVSEKITKDDKKKDYDYSDKHVLLVEDNELNREIAMAILEETGMTIDCAEDGDVAVATINREPADKYDLILMDVQMPRMDGYTATREIRTLADNKKANIPIVAMTANAFEEDKKKAYESGMNGHIIKPISIEEIAKVLDEIFAGRE